MVGEWTNNNPTPYYKDPRLSVVASRPGPGTGDTYIKTADGRWWERAKQAAPQTGEVRAVQRGNQLYHS